MMKFFKKIDLPLSTLLTIITLLGVVTSVVWWSVEISGKIALLDRSVKKIESKFNTLTIGAGGENFESISAEIQRLGKLEIRISELQELTEKIGNVDDLVQDISKVENFTQNIEKVEKLEQRIAILASMERNIDVIVNFDSFVDKVKTDRKKYDRRISKIEDTIRNFVAEYPSEADSSETIHPNKQKRGYLSRRDKFPIGTILLSTIPPESFSFSSLLNSFDQNSWVPAQGQRVGKSSYTALSGQDRLPSINPIHQNEYSVYYYVKVQ